MTDGFRQSRQKESNLSPTPVNNDQNKCETKNSCPIPEESTKSYKDEFDMITDSDSESVHDLCLKDKISSEKNVSNESLNGHAHDSYEVNVNRSAVVNKNIPKHLYENAAAMSNQCQVELLNEKSQEAINLLNIQNIGKPLKIKKEATCSDDVNKSDANKMPTVSKSKDIIDTSTATTPVYNSNRKLDSGDKTNKKPTRQRQTTANSPCIIVSTEPVETPKNLNPIRQKRTLPSEICAQPKSISTGNVKPSNKIPEKKPKQCLPKKKVLTKSSESWQDEIQKYVTNFNWPLMKFRDGRTKILVGGTGLGKTSYALAHFKHPIVITSKQQFRLIKADSNVCTGIVIDNVELRSMSAIDVLLLFDTRQDTTVDIPNGYAKIPAGLPRIVICNVLGTVINEAWNDKIKDAISSRYNIYNVNGQLYNGVPNEIMKNVYTDSNDEYINENMDLLSNNKQ